MALILAVKGLYLLCSSQECRGLFIMLKLGARTALNGTQCFAVYTINALLILMFYDSGGSVNGANGGGVGGGGTAFRPLNNNIDFIVVAGGTYRWHTCTYIAANNLVILHYA